ncbi:hypothetical protein C8F01DRAFT_1098489 [Mycena amicta]|nr:hypothetical protein C8F01DRAFT_1098489 [Mycena amicta]
MPVASSAALMPTSCFLRPPRKQTRMGSVLNASFCLAKADSDDRPKDLCNSESPDVAVHTITDAPPTGSTLDCAELGLFWLAKADSDDRPKDLCNSELPDVAVHTITDAPPTGSTLDRAEFGLFCLAKAESDDRPKDLCNSESPADVAVHTITDAPPTGSTLDRAELAGGSHWRFNTEIPLFLVTLILKGVLNLATREIDAALSAKIPFVGSFVLTHVKGSLTRDIAVGFDIRILAGTAVYYERDGCLWMSLTARVYEKQHGPLEVKLFSIPEQFKARL